MDTTTKYTIVKPGEEIERGDERLWKGVWEVIEHLPVECPTDWIVRRKEVEKTPQQQLAEKLASLTDIEKDNIIVEMGLTIACAEGMNLDKNCCNGMNGVALAAELAAETRNKEYYKRLLKECARLLQPTTDEDFVGLVVPLNLESRLQDLQGAVDDSTEEITGLQQRVDDEIATTVALQGENTELRQRLERMRASRDAWKDQCGIWSDKYEKECGTDLPKWKQETCEKFRALTAERDLWKDEAERWRAVNNSVVLEEFNKHVALGHKFFGKDGYFPDALVVGQDVVLDGMWWLVDSLEKATNKLKRLQGVASVAGSALNRISKES